MFILVYSSACWEDTVNFSDSGESLVLPMHVETMKNTICEKEEVTKELNLATFSHEN
jgi:hypothetical protein